MSIRGSLARALSRLLSWGSIQAPDYPPRVSWTDRARHVLDRAQREAGALNHEYVGTEHLLLALAADPDSLAAAVLRSSGISGAAIATTVANLVRPGPRTVRLGRAPLTPRARSALKHAAEESRALGHRYIGTEHLLLGLLGEDRGVAVQALAQLGLTLPEARARLRSGFEAAESENPRLPNA